MENMLNGASKQVRRMAMLLAGGSLIWLAATQPAFAQVVTDDDDDAATAAAEEAAGNEPASSVPTEGGPIVVTGSRITASGFAAPTPTTVIGVEQLQQAAQPNIYDAIAQLPAIQGSNGTTAVRQNGNTSFGNNGLSTLNLRGLGPIRTLTLLDGQRVVPAHITGVTDVSQFPQLLIQRVDVVTGGASASWGSDAISGVVNFVTDKRFVGFRGNLQGGISTFGDDESVLAQAAAGFSLAEDRLHVQIAGEYYKNEGVPGGKVGGQQPNGRPDSYRSGTTSYALAATPAGSPQFFSFRYDAQTQTLGRFGLITAGPLQGRAFDANGQVYQFQYGSPCISQVCQGGQQDNYITTNTIDNPIERKVGYARIGFEVTPDIELYGTALLSQVESLNTPIAYPRKPANLTIQCTNAFLPAQIVSACGTAGITSFQYGTANANFPAIEIIDTDRRQMRFVAGATGTLDLSTPISFDLYFQHGENHTDVIIDNMTLNGRYNAAIDAVRLNGQIVCKSDQARAAGCIPINIFGGFPVSAEQFAWLAPANGPFQKNTFKEDVASVSFNMTPFSTGAGEVSLAFGGEYRKESYVTLGDPYGDGVSPANPNTAAYPADPLQNAAGGNNWFAGNFHSGSGAFDVIEGFVEIGLPLFDSDEMGKLDFNAAGRVAKYSTSGTATTWKVGATWATPLEGFRIRGVISKDLRAPNLSELFAPPQSASQNVINRATTKNVQVLAQTVGNPNLVPEIAKTYEIGAVYRPEFAPGLNLSVDYYDITLNQAIAALTNQQIVDLCFNGNTAFCPNVKLTGSLASDDPPFVIIQPFNLASVKARGLDFEASYQANLGGVGKLTLRALANRAIDLVLDTGIGGQQISQQAGNNSETGSGVPRWKALFSQSLNFGRATLTLTERYITSGKINVDAITCAAPSCPVSTVQNPTVNFNHVPGALYVDVGGSFDVVEDAEVYFKVDNLFNHRAPPFGSTLLYDVVGRMFRLGVRFSI